MYEARSRKTRPQGLRSIDIRDRRHRSTGDAHAKASRYRLGHTPRARRRADLDDPACRRATSRSSPFAVPDPRSRRQDGPGRPRHGTHRPRRPPRRARLEVRPRRERVHPERSRRRPARDRADRGLGRLRRPRPLRRRVLPRLRAREDPQAARPPRQRHRLRLVRRGHRPLLRQAVGLPLRRQSGRLDHRHGALERYQRGRLLGRRLGDQGRRQRRGLDGRDPDPLQPDPLPQEGRVRLGRQLQAHGPAQERALELQLGPEERVGRGVAVRPPRRPARASARAGASSSCPTPWPRPSSGPSRPAIPSRPGASALGNAGFDLKVGLKSNLTLDATVNPDFGQVEVDPAVLNLSAYETYYQEKRPFFIEGASLFNNFGRGGVFIERQHQLAPAEVLLQPARRAGAAGLRDRGRVRARARPHDDPRRGQAHREARRQLEHRLAQRRDRPRVRPDRPAAGLRLSQEVEPLHLLRGPARPEGLRPRAGTASGCMATGVARDIGDDGALAAILNKNAFALAVGRLGLPRQEEGLGRRRLGRGRRRSRGRSEDILRLQTSSMHYFQRPDATHVEVDPTATRLSGWAGRINLAKQSGHLLVLASAGAISPGFDPNDVGYQSGASDIVNLQFLPGYQWTKPGKVFRQRARARRLVPQLRLRAATRSGTAGSSSSRASSGISGCSTSCSLYNPETISKNLTRGGPLARHAVGIPVRTWASRRTAASRSSSSSWERRTSGRRSRRNGKAPAVGALEAGLELQPVGGADAVARRHTSSNG
ncbi:MAG: DUF5916 domain-containing protein [Desulfosudis oleivorans]|nr:DUF5916 domain-containing protein [Desulfosudis oleivorans]